MQPTAAPHPNTAKPHMQMLEEAVPAAGEDLITVTNSSFGGLAP